mmetsp:Transcript_6507/g.21759  ORF Transcript_6507/g.21759 Transcript_6507/m.21759 type:complete len:283 (+) Transcript_6507:1022-1870(+)
MWDRQSRGSLPRLKDCRTSCCTAPSRALRCDWKTSGASLSRVCGCTASRTSCPPDLWLSSRVGLREEREDQRAKEDRSSERRSRFCRSSSKTMQRLSTLERRAHGLSGCSREKRDRSTSAFRSCTSPSFLPGSYSFGSCACACGHMSFLRSALAQPFLPPHSPSTGGSSSSSSRTSTPSRNSASQRCRCSRRRRRRRHPPPPSVATNRSSPSTETAVRALPPPPPPPQSSPPAHRRASCLSSANDKPGGNAPGPHALRTRAAAAVADRRASSRRSRRPPSRA